MDKAISKRKPTSLNHRSLSFPASQPASQPASRPALAGSATLSLSITRIQLSLSLSLFPFCFFFESFAHSSTAKGARTHITSLHLVFFSNSLLSFFLSLSLKRARALPFSLLPLPLQSKGARSPSLAIRFQRAPNQNTLSLSLSHTKFVEVPLTSPGTLSHRSPAVFFLLNSARAESSRFVRMRQRERERHTHTGERERASERASELFIYIPARSFSLSVLW